ncbi:MAG TPA: hypothetical protein VFV93_10430, partial [Thermomicrobiales bacterium]|nr:hypothetical protein [Thermomicrobiales bacterium]
GWLGPEALLPRAGTGSDGSRTLASVELTEVDLDRLSIDARSTASGGDYFVASERGSGVPLIWNVDGNRPRRLTSDITDLAWFNHGTAAIGVAAGQAGDSGSRIVVTAADIASTTAYLDHQYFDPANLGSSADQRYARPMVSPAGALVSFFVVDRLSGDVSLWLDTGEGAAEVVAGWTLPVQRALDPPLVATWASPDTLLFAMPADWHDGLPQTTAFMRLTLSSDTPQLDELARIDASRGAKGIVLAELALSPDGSLLAYRLRQFDSVSGSNATEDTLHVAGTDNLNQAIELERGGSSDGLLWTTAGDQLVAGIRGRIALYSADGRDLAYLSPRGVHASYPLLIGRQVWFEAVDDRGERVWQVDLEE